MIKEKGNISIHTENIFPIIKKWLYSDKETIAVRAYCIDLLIKYALEEPELKNEICIAFENLPVEDYPSLWVRCRNGIKLLKNVK